MPKNTNKLYLASMSKRFTCSCGMEFFVKNNKKLYEMKIRLHNKKCKDDEGDRRTIYSRGDYNGTIGGGYNRTKQQSKIIM